MNAVQVCTRCFEETCADCAQGMTHEHEHYCVECWQIIGGDALAQLEDDLAAWDSAA